MRPSDSRISATALLLSRGIRCVVLHPDDEDGETLTNHLRRMGFKVQAFWPIPEQLPADTDPDFLCITVQITPSQMCLGSTTISMP